MAYGSGGHRWPYLTRINSSAVRPGWRRTAIDQAVTDLIFGNAVAGGGGGTSTDAFFDNFDDNSKDTAKWQGTADLIGPTFFLTRGGSVAEANGRVEITTPASADGVDGYASLSTSIALAGRSMRIRMTPPGTNPTTNPGHFYFVVADVTDGVGGASYWAGWNIHFSRFGTTSITAQINNSGDSGTPWQVAYDPVDHAWLRLDFAADNSTLTYYTAPDVSGVPGTWTLRRTVASPTYVGWPSGAQLAFYAEADNNLQSAWTWQVDNFNWLPGTGGNSYTGDITEAATATDDASSTQTAVRSATEAATATDAASTVASLNGTASEAATAADAASSNATMGSAASEAATAADTQSGGLVVAGTTSETATATDDASASVGAASRDITESTSAADAESATIVASSAATEPATAADAASTTAVLNGAVSELGSAADSGSGSVVVAAAASEPGTATDAESATLSTSRAITESATAADDVSGSLGTLTRDQAEAATATDAASASAVTAASATEAAAATDTESATRVSAVDATESATATDTESATLTASRSVTESATAADSASSAAVPTMTVSEPATATDTESGSTLIAASATEPATATDTESATRVSVSTITESVTATDDVTADGAAVAIVNEPTAATDAESAAMLGNGAIAETAAAADAVSATVVTAAAVAEAAAAADSSVAGQGVSGAVTEPAAAVDEAATVVGPVEVYVTEAAAALDDVAGNLTRLCEVFEQASAGVGLSAQHAAWLERLARINGLVDPLVNTDTQRSDGTMVQSVTPVGAALRLTPVAGPTGAAGPSALTPQQAEWLEMLARRFGLIDPMDVTTTQRSDGVLTQTIVEAPGTVTVTRV